MGDDHPYVDHLPGLADPSVDALRETVALFGKAPPLRKPDGSRHALVFAQEELEAPSVRLAFELALRQLGLLDDVELKLTAKIVPKPDPRLPVRPVAHELWRYEGTLPVIVPKEPPKAIGEAVDDLADCVFTAESWLEEGARIAKKLDADAIASLLASALYPTMPPAGYPSWEWVRRRQMAVAFLVASMGKEKWKGSRRRAALESMLLGPLDWTVDAAATALGQLALAGTKAIQKEVDALFFDRMMSRPKDVYCCYKLPLVCAWRRLPSLSPDVREVVEDQYRKFTGATAE